MALRRASASAKARWAAGVSGGRGVAGSSVSGTSGIGPGLQFRHVVLAVNGRYTILGDESSSSRGLGSTTMLNFLRTGILFAVLTALFMAVGYFIGGTNGMLIAFGVAAVTNLFAFWNSDKMVLSMQGAHEVDPRSAPDLYDMVERLARNAGIPTP